MNPMSTQIIYCNCCGKRSIEVLCNTVGSKFKCCSTDCIKKMEDRYARSILGETMSQEDLLSCGDESLEMLKKFEKEELNQN